MNSYTPVLDRKEIQKLIAYGFNVDYCRHYILSIKDDLRAGQFIIGLIALVTNAAGNEANSDHPEAQQSAGVSIGFTFAGLKALKVSSCYLDVFRHKARAFTEGAS